MSPKAQKTIFVTAIFTVLGLFCNFIYVPGTAPNCNLPLDVTTKIGRAQIFTKNIPDRNVLTKTQFIWGDSGPKVAGTFTSIYMPSSRDMNRERAFGEDSTKSDYNHSSYYDSTNGNWIMWAYQLGDSRNPLSPKIDFSYKGLYGVNNSKSGIFIYPPVDISNTTVQNYLFNQYLKPKIAGQNAIALDNASAYNTGNLGEEAPGIPVGGRIGILVNGQLTPPAGSGQKALGLHNPVLYSGAELDDNYADDFVYYMRRITGLAHTNGVCSIANNKYRNSDPDGNRGFLRVAKEVDISLDETGFTRHDEGASSCRPVPAHDNSKGLWFKRMRALQTIAGDLSKGFVIVDKTCAYQTQLTFEHFEWPLANFMLVKGAHSYLSLQAIDSGSASNFIASVPNTDGDRKLMNMDLIFQMNTGSPARTNLSDGASQEGVYYRQFSKALAVVNPNLTEKNYTIPVLAAGYRYQGRFDNKNYAGGTTITLPPLSAKVFIKVSP